MSKEKTIGPGLSFFFSKFQHTMYAQHYITIKLSRRMGGAFVWTCEHFKLANILNYILDVTHLTQHQAVQAAVVCNMFQLAVYLVWSCTSLTQDGKVSAARSLTPAGLYDRPLLFVFGSIVQEDPQVLSTTIFPRPPPSHPSVEQGCRQWLEPLSWRS